MSEPRKIVVVIGTRPDVVKLAPVIAALRRRPESCIVRVLFTSQHRQLAASILRYFDLSPDHDLDVMIAGQSLPEVTSRVLLKAGAIYDEERPDLVVVQGDTTSAMAAAMAAFYRKIPVAHVEAGLRTEQIYDPFPEEMNRRLITRLASLHLAATTANRDALLRENVPAGAIRVTGNPVIDALRGIVADPHVEPPAVAREITGRGNRIVVLTTHRRENFGEPQREIFRAVHRVVQRHPELELVFPVHPNPAVAHAIDEYLPEHPRVHRIEPIEYPPFIRLLAMSHFAMTDSGGLQEECPALGVPTLILRATTERQEAVDAGSALLVGVACDAIVAAADQLMSDPGLYARMSVPRYPFGRGDAAERIADAIEEAGLTIED